MRKKATLLAFGIVAAFSWAGSLLAQQSKIEVSEGTPYVLLEKNEIPLHELVYAFLSAADHWYKEGGDQWTGFLRRYGVHPSSLAANRIANAMALVRLSVESRTPAEILASVDGDREEYRAAVRVAEIERVRQLAIVWAEVLTAIDGEAEDGGIPAAAFEEIVSERTKLGITTVVVGDSVGSDLDLLSDLRSEFEDELEERRNGGAK